MPLGEEFYSLKSKHRVIAMFHDRAMFPQIFQKFEMACYSLANRDDLRIGLMEDKVKILNYVKSIQNVLPSNTKNLILLVNDVQPVDLRVLDLEINQNADIQLWLH